MAQAARRVERTEVQDRTKVEEAHHPMKPYNRWVLDSPRNLNAESPSKNWVSGIAPLAASRLNQPLLAILRFVWRGWRGCAA